MRRLSLLVLAPLACVAVVAAGFLWLDPLAGLSGAVPPPERITFERVVLDDDGIRARVRAGGGAPLGIAQVRVDGAYWRFAQEPAGPLPPLATAWLRIPYPWVLGESHHLDVVTSTGTTFSHTIDVATPTPRPDGGTFGSYALVGLFVGLVPVALGMLFYPALRRGGGAVTTFALGLTVGLLAFLFVDTLVEALERAAEAAPGLEAGVLVWLVVAATAALLLATGRLSGDGGGLRLATMIALGIGLHNLGEGLAIGSALATGAVALGTFLVFGFMLHNVTEGIGIVAPLLDRRPPLAAFAALAALAGLPAVAGMWIGAYAFVPHWAAVALAVGAGAILQVVIELARMLWRRAAAEPGLRAVLPQLSGGLLGVAAMWGTALLTQG